MQTLTSYLLAHLHEHPDQTELLLMMSDLQTIAKIISRETNRIGLSGVLGSEGSLNVQGEVTQKLDVFANNLCKLYLEKTGHFLALASEEEQDAVCLKNTSKSPKYVIAFDPLDGSSNIDVNVSIGTIFSVHRAFSGVSANDLKHFLQPGRDQVLAGYILYGSSTVLVFSFGDGVHEFTLDQGLGEFVLSHEKIQLPKTCEIYSVNEGNTLYFSPQDRRFIEELKFEKKLSTRYIGSLVADFHRNLKKGGIFLYPGIDKEGLGKYHGKLRLNYEAKPLAFLLQQAGGIATDGWQNILDIIPTELHQRTPLVMGNPEVIEEYIGQKSQISI